MQRGNEKISRSRKADNILQALLTHRTIKEAAQAANVSERVVYDYLNDPAFENRYKAARDNILNGVSNNLREKMSKAVDIIDEIMSDPENRPQDRLSAAKAVLEYSARFIENQDITERLNKLKSMITEAQEQ